MDTTALIGILRGGLDTVQKLEPLAALGGPAAVGVANIVAGLAQIGEDALENIQTGAKTATSDDQDELKQILAQLRRDNDDMAKDIAG